VELSEQREFYARFLEIWELRDSPYLANAAEAFVDWWEWRHLRALERQQARMARLVRLLRETAPERIPRRMTA
jgi:hypothetical protein